MFPIMKFASKLNGYLFCFMLIALFLYSLPAVYQFSTSQKADETFGWFEDGKVLRKFEKFYDKRFFLREPSAQMWANLRYRLFNEGTSGVLIGNDGWLFTNQEYLVPGDWRSSMAGQARQIAEIQARLRAHNKRLVLLPVPMKVDIYAEHARRPADQRALSVYDDFVGQLAASGVDTVSLREAFVAARTGTDALFVANDTHWSPAGARLAAQTLAQTHPQLAGMTDYQSRQVGEKEHRGDLVNYLQFDPALAPHLFVPVRLLAYETLKTRKGDTADDLFGDQSIALALVGTSYSKFDDWNFVGFLKEALHSDLVDFSQEAYGPFQAMEIFLADKALADPDIQTVIWEFPVRTVLAQRYLLKAAKANPENHL